MGPAETRFRCLVDGHISVDEFLDLSLQIERTEDGCTLVTTADETVRVRPWGERVPMWSSEFARRLCVRDQKGLRG